MKVRVINKGKYKGYLLFCGKYIYNPHTYVDAEIFFVDKFNETDCDLVDFYYTDPTKYDLPPEPLSPAPLPPASNASCEKACKINLRRREHAVKRAKALRQENNELKYRLQKAQKELEHVAWVLENGLVNEGNSYSTRVAMIDLLKYVSLSDELEE